MTSDVLGDLLSSRCLEVGCIRNSTPRYAQAKPLEGEAFKSISGTWGECSREKQDQDEGTLALTPQI